MTHKKIKRFQVEVEFLDDSDMIRIKNQYENILVSNMRDAGYIRVLDIDPVFSVEFDGQTWKFLMTIHGIYIGKRKARVWDGITQNKLIQRTTRQRTLSQ